jgi:hypothetical protein
LQKLEGALEDLALAEGSGAIGQVAIAQAQSLAAMNDDHRLDRALARIDITDRTVVDLIVTLAAANRHDQAREVAEQRIAFLRSEDEERDVAQLALAVTGNLMRSRTTGTAFSSSDLVVLSELPTPAQIEEIYPAATRMADRRLIQALFSAIDADRPDLPLMLNGPERPDLVLMHHAILERAAGNEEAVSDLVAASEASFERFFPGHAAALERINRSVRRDEERADIVGALALLAALAGDGSTVVARLLEVPDGVFVSSLSRNTPQIIRALIPEDLSIPAERRELVNALTGGPDETRRQIASLAATRGQEDWMAAITSVSPAQRDWPRIQRLRHLLDEERFAEAEAELNRENWSSDDMRNGRLEALISFAEKLPDAEAGMRETALREAFELSADPLDKVRAAAIAFSVGDNDLGLELFRGLPMEDVPFLPAPFVSSFAIKNANVDGVGAYLTEHLVRTTAYAELARAEGYPRDAAQAERRHHQVVLWAIDRMDDL